jgi:hypothetical protein
MKRLLILTLMLTTLLIAGCSDDSEATNNMTADMAQADMDTTTDMPAGDMTYNPPAMYATSYQLRFDSLVFDIPRKLKALNGILAQNFDQTKPFPVIILVEIKDINTTAGTMKLRGGAGAKTATAGTYSWDPDNDEMYFDGTLDPATGRVAGTIRNFKFVATFETEDPQMPLRSTLPINQLDFEGYLEPAPEGAGRAIIKIGKIEGNISKAQADSTMITIIAGNPPISLTTLLGADLVDLDLDNDGTKDAWSVKNATFTAVAVTIQ